MVENCVSFILNNSLAAVSAVMKDGRIHATDGFENIIHRFDGDGTFIEHIDVLRPYRRLRNDSESPCFTALGCSCSSGRLYFLNSNFTETGYTDIDTSCPQGCGCSKGCDDLSEVTDASLTFIGEERFIVAAFRKSAYLFDMNGRRLTRLCSAEADEILTDFISAGNGVFAMSTLRNSTRTVTVSDNGKIFTGILDPSYSLRMIFYFNGDIYGLFGRGYIYNYICRIYSDGEFSLPGGRTAFCE